MLSFAHGQKLKNGDGPKKVEVFFSNKHILSVEMGRTDLKMAWAKREYRKTSVNKCYKRVYLHMLS